MIERQILAEKLKEKDIEDFVFSYLGKLSCSHVMVQRTPLGEKIIVHTSRPGLIVGRKGANIKAITEVLKKKFGMENPQIEVEEIVNPALDASSVTRVLISGFQRFGPKRFKAMAYKALQDALRAGALGIEVVISGRGVPGERAKMWRFSAGYLKKSGDISANHTDRCYEGCDLKSGTIGIKVSILHPDVVLPDKMKIKKAELAADVTSGAQIKASESAVKKEELKKAGDKKEKKKTSNPRKKKEEKIKGDHEDKKEEVKEKIKEELKEETKEETKSEESKGGEK